MNDEWITLIGLCPVAFLTFLWLRSQWHRSHKTGPYAYLKEAKPLPPPQPQICNSCGTSTTNIGFVSSNGYVVCSDCRRIYQSYHPVEDNDDSHSNSNSYSDYDPSENVGPKWWWPEHDKEVYEETGYNPYTGKYE